MQEENSSIIVTTTTPQPVEAKENKEASPQAEKVETKAVSEESDESLEESATSKEDISNEELDEESDDSDDSGDEEQRPKQKNSLKKRFSKLTQAKRLAEERAYKLEMELAQLRQGSGNNQKDTHENTKANIEGKPDPKNFDSHADYLEAVLDWREAEKEKKAEAKRTYETKEQMQKTYDEKVQEYKKTQPDFDQVIADVAPLVHSQTFLEAIVGSEFGPQIAYELAQNPNEVVRLQTLTPEALNRVLGRLEAKYENASSKPEEKTIKKTNAPRPISPVGSNSPSAKNKTIFDKDLSQDEYERLRKKASG